MKVTCVVLIAGLVAVGCGGGSSGGGDMAEPELIAPQNVVVTPRLNQLDVSWDPVPGAVFYNVHINGSLTNMTNETKYQFLVVPTYSYEYDSDTAFRIWAQGKLWSGPEYTGQGRPCTYLRCSRVNSHPNEFSSQPFVVEVPSAVVLIDRGGGKALRTTDAGMTFSSTTVPAIGNAQLVTGGESIVLYDGFQKYVVSTDGGLSFSSGTFATPESSVILHDGTKFVVVGSAFFRTSTDGKSWTDGPAPTGAACQSAGAYGNGTYLCSSGDSIKGAILGSSDGKTWAKRADFAASRIIFAGGRFMLAASTALYSSSDGLTFTVALDGSVAEVLYADGKFFAGGSDFAVSSDGVTFQKYFAQPEPPPFALRGGNWISSNNMNGVTVGPKRVE